MAYHLLFFLSYPKKEEKSIAKSEVDMKYKRIKSLKHKKNLAHVFAKRREKKVILSHDSGYHVLFMMYYLI